MKILVCIKQVPESDAAPGTDRSEQWVVFNQHLKYKMNRFDEYALEEALLIKETTGGVSIDVITVGSEKSGEVIKRAFGMGADRGIHIVISNNKYNDPNATAKLIADEVKKEKYDLILTGIMSEDMMQAQTGQMLAEYLNLPCSTGIISLEIQPDQNSVIAKREIEGGLREGIKAQLPALFTIQAGINTPRYPTLSNILKADTKELISIKKNTGEQLQKAVSVRPPIKSRAGTFLEGSAEEKAKQLYSILKDKNTLI